MVEESDRWNGGWCFSFGGECIEQASAGYRLELT